MLTSVKYLVKYLISMSIRCVTCVIHLELELDIKCSKHFAAKWWYPNLTAVTINHSFEHAKIVYSASFTPKARSGEGGGVRNVLVS